MLLLVRKFCFILLSNQNLKVNINITFIPHGIIMFYGKFLHTCQKFAWFQLKNKVHVESLLETHANVPREMLVMKYGKGDHF
jgi:hypothetical protein